MLIRKLDEVLKLLQQQSYGVQATRLESRPTQPDATAGSEFNKKISRLTGLSVGR